MPSEEEVYRRHAAEYEGLIAAEDYQGNILKTLKNITTPDGKAILDLGSGTGRLADLLAARARSFFAFDLSHHMLTVTREKLQALAPGRGLAAAADHRWMPLPAGCADLVISSWSVSYLAVWNPDHWRAELEAWLAEMQRVLRPGGSVVLLESLGTGNEAPLRLPHLVNFYPWLDEAGFENTWIRTDYRFVSAEEADRLAGFFFGEEMAERIRRETLTVLPECTGVWWKTFP
jgi:ubiquinone/menaquinone biosynthesis C-methylase UbiE